MRTVVLRYADAQRLLSRMPPGTNQDEVQKFVSECRVLERAKENVDKLSLVREDMLGVFAKVEGIERIMSESPERVQKIVGSDVHLLFDTLILYVRTAAKTTVPTLKINIMGEDVIHFTGVAKESVLEDAHCLFYITESLTMLHRLREATDTHLQKILATYLDIVDVFTHRSLKAYRNTCRILHETVSSASS